MKETSLAEGVCFPSETFARALTRVNVNTHAQTCEAIYVDLMSKAGFNE